MKGSFTSICALILFHLNVNGQMFTPSASVLPDGDLGEPYVGQVIDFTVPQNATISGEVVVQALALVYPQTQPVLGFLNIDNQDFPMVVDRVTLLPQGLAPGMSATCDATPCTYIEGASGYLTIAGTPTAAGQFTFNINTLTEGAVDISSITGGILSTFGLPTSLGLPTPVPSNLTEEGYTILVQNTSNIAEHNELFNLRMSPNPAFDQAQLLVSTKQGGLFQIEVYNVLGELEMRDVQSVSAGDNRLKLDVSGLASGTHLVKANLNGHDALIRVLIR